MAAIGFLLVGAGIIALIIGLLQRMKAGRVTDAPLATTGDVVAKGPSLVGPKGQISAQGQVMCQQPVYAPMSGQPCLFYELKVTAEWKDGDSTKTKEIEHQKVAAQIAINDGSGPLWVDLREGGDYEPMDSKQQQQSTGLLKGIVGGELMFGNYRLNAGMFSLGTKYTVEEKVLPVQQSLYVCGKLADGGGMIISPKWRNLIVSNKTRDQLLASAMKTAKIALIAGAASLVIGGTLAGVASAMGPSKEELAAAQAEADANAKAAAAAAAASASAMADDDESGAPAATGAPVKPGTKPTVPAKSTTPAKSATAATAATSAAPAATTAAPAKTAATATVATPSKTPVLSPTKK